MLNKLVQKLENLFFGHRKLTLGIIIGFTVIMAFFALKLKMTAGFDKQMPGWNVPMEGPMNGANQALSYIVFDRDKKIFADKFPQLEIVHQAPLSNYLRYLMSGGLNFRQLAPNSFIPVLKGVERLLYPVQRQLALHHLIAVRRN